MAVVLDYSFARPDPAELARASTGVMRYLGYGPKVLTIHERDDLHRAGLSIGLVWETTARRMDDGGLAGASDAVAANDQADGLGWPTRPIYFANDQNGYRPEHLAYMQAAKAASRRPVGAYGGSAGFQSACGEAGVPFLWAVSTWGLSPRYPPCLVQEANTPPPIPGTDVNSARADDWGGWRPHMPTGQDLLTSAYRFRGEPYSTAPGRTSESSGFKDCSGLIYASLTGVGIQPGGMVSTSLELWAINNGGRYLTSVEAQLTPAAGVAIWGYGDRGHIGLSVGDGRQCFETPSAEGHKAGFSPFHRNNWDRFFTWPGIDHNGTPKRSRGMHTMFVLLAGTQKGQRVLDTGATLIVADDVLYQSHEFARKIDAVAFQVRDVKNAKTADLLWARATS